MTRGANRLPAALCYPSAATTCNSRHTSLPAICSKTAVASLALGGCRMFSCANAPAPGMPLWPIASAAASMLL